MTRIRIRCHLIRLIVHHLVLLVHSARLTQVNPSKEFRLQFHGQHNESTHILPLFLKIKSISHS